MDQQQPPPDGVEVSGLLDWFSSVDNRLEQTNALLETLTRQSGTQTSDTVGGSDIQEFPFPLSANIPAGTSRQDGYGTEFDAPFDATLSRVVMECDPSSQQGLGVKVSDGVGGVWVPRGGELRYGADNSEEPEFQTIPTQTLTIRPNVTVDEDNPVKVQFINNDPENPHWATVVAFMRRRV